MPTNLNIENNHACSFLGAEWQLGSPHVHSSEIVFLARVSVLFLPSSDLDRGVEIRFVVFLLVLREEKETPILERNGTGRGDKIPQTFGVTTALLF